MLAKELGIAFSTVNRWENCKGKPQYTCYVPDSLRSVKITGGEILYGAFSGCTLLTEVIVPETIKTVADYAFYYCSNLKQFTIPVTVESIGDHAFYYCYDLKSITIPDRITRIGNYAFCYCSGLERVTLGKGIIGIEGSAFSACTRLTTINIPERVTSIGDYAINSERDFRKTQQKISNNIENSLQMIA